MGELFVVQKIERTAFIIGQTDAHDGFVDHTTARKMLTMDSGLLTTAQHMGSESARK